MASCPERKVCDGAGSKSTNRSSHGKSLVLVPAYELSTALREQLSLNHDTLMGYSLGTQNQSGCTAKPEAGIPQSSEACPIVA